MEIFTEKREAPTARILDPGTEVRQLFCAKCEGVRDHSIRVDHNEEIVAECALCDRFLKFPKGHSFEGK